MVNVLIFCNFRRAWSSLSSSSSWSSQVRILGVELVEAVLVIGLKRGLISTS